MVDLHELPAGLPVPQDDGAARGLVGRRMPSVVLPATSRDDVDLAALGAGRTVLYVYPRTGRPGEELPDGWDATPGARGCTAEACDFRDHLADLVRAGADRVLGLSGQDTAYQRELVGRLHLPYPMLADPDLVCARELGLPPDQHAREVLAWLEHA